VKVDSRKKKRGRELLRRRRRRIERQRDEWEAEEMCLRGKKRKELKRIRIHFSFPGWDNFNSVKT
jgi:hypothetical protein